METELKHLILKLKIKGILTEKDVKDIWSDYMKEVKE